MRVEILSLLAVICATCQSGEETVPVSSITLLRDEQSQRWLAGLLNLKEEARGEAIEKLYGEQGPKCIQVVLELIRITGGKLDIGNAPNPDALSEQERKRYFQTWSLYLTTPQPLLSGLKSVDGVPAKAISPYLYCGKELQHLAISLVNAKNKKELHTWGLWEAAEELYAFALLTGAEQRQEWAGTYAKEFLNGKPPLSLQIAAMRALLFVDNKAATEKAREIINNHNLNPDLRMEAMYIWARLGTPAAEMDGLGYLVENLKYMGTRGRALQLINELSAEHFTGAEREVDREKIEKWYKDAVRDGKRLVKTPE